MVERCRYCGRTLDRDDPEHRKHWPFCCQRCRMAELDNWLEGRYVITRPLSEPADEGAQAPPGAPRPPEGAKNSS